MGDAHSFIAFFTIATFSLFSLPRFKVTSGAHEFEVRQKNEEMKAERQRAKAAAFERQAASGRGTANTGIRLNNARLFSRGGRVGATGRGISKFIVHGKVDPKLVAAKDASSNAPGSEPAPEEAPVVEDEKEVPPDADGRSDQEDDDAGKDFKTET